MEKNLGHATAYGYAKSKGYSGTEEEFAELMADYASVGQSAAQSAEQAAASATSASGSAATAASAAQTATSKASEAVTAAGTATTKASEASTSADTASAAALSASTSAQTATTATSTATTKASEAAVSANTATTAKTDAETARDAAVQSASRAAESARTLTIDATLTQAGQAADAKAVGEKLTDLKSALSDEHISIMDMQEYLGRDIVYKGVYVHGSVVSFNTTKTAVSANQGYTVTVSVNDTANPNANFFLYTKYVEDETYDMAGRITSGGSITFTSEKTLEYVGVYLTNLESGSLTIMVTVNSNVDLISNINSKVDKDGIAQVATINLQDVKSNILFSQRLVSVAGTGNYVQTTILQYVGEFKTGDKFVILCDSVTGESVVSPSSPYAIELYNEQGDEIRTRQHEDVEITASDINNGLSAIHFILYPAKGTKLPTGRATYTNVRIIKGETEEYSLIGSLAQAVKSITGNDVGVVPEYFLENDYLDTKAARINQLAESCAGNGDVFLFITDEHWDFGYNQKHAPALIEYIANKCNIPRLFDGGDSANGTSIEFINALHKAYNHDIHHIMGNHDWMLNRSGDYLAYYFDSFGYNQVGNVEKHYYYVDNVQKKIRYIILNAWRSDLTQSNTLVSAYDAEQLNWFTGTALNVEFGWDIIIFTHYIKDGSKYAPDGALAFANAIDNYDGNGNIICVLEGHTHWDNISHTNGGVPVIATTCDKNGSWISDGTNMEPWLDEQRPDGTIYEQAFDVVCLNRTTRKITMVRIGALAMDNVDKTFGESGFTTTGTLEERVITY